MASEDELRFGLMTGNVGGILLTSVILTIALELWIALNKC